MTAAAAVADRLRRGHRHRNHRVALVCALLAVAGLSAVAVAVYLGGSADATVAEVTAVLLGADDPTTRYFVFQMRLPRALAALAAGAVFGLAGVLYQRILRNPLATPDIIGISSGAGMGAVLVMLTVGGTGVAVQGGALLAAVALAGAIFWLSWNKGVPEYRLILVGIGLSAVCASVTNYLISRAGDMNAQRAYQWMVGSLNGVDWDGVIVLFMALSAGWVACLVLRGPLAGLVAGEHLATGLGVRVVLARAAVLLVGAALAALAASVVGPIGFVSLVCGPIAVRLTGHGREFTAAALTGALIVGAADVAALNTPLISPVPTGAITALLGAPLLVWILMSGRSR